MKADLDDSTQNDYGDVTQTATCPAGYASVGARAQSNIDKGTGAVGIIKLWIGERCCPLEWRKVIVDSGEDEPAPGTTPD
jgi:hypothetical protein